MVSNEVVAYPLPASLKVLEYCSLEYVEFQNSVSRAIVWNCGFVSLVPELFQYSAGPDSHTCT